MELREMMMQRRSIRKYTGEPIPEEQKTMILQAGLLAESSRSRRPWELYVVENPELLKKLSGCRVGSAKMLENAGMAVVVMADPACSDVWVEDCSIVMAHMHLMADSLGLGSCWIQGRLREAPDGYSTEAYVKKVLDIPGDWVLEAILSVGVPAQRPEGYGLEDLNWGKVHFCK